MTDDELKGPEIIPDYGDDVPEIDDAEPEDTESDHTGDISEVADDADR